MNKNKIVYEGWTFQGNDFKDGNMFLATSLLSSQLQVNSFEATVKSADPSIINFERNSKLIYYYDNRQQGIFYVQDIERAGPDTYKISATSTLGLLTEGKHYGGIYTGQTAQEIISDICGSVPFIIKNNLSGTKLYGWLPIAAPRDNLSQVLFAIGAALKTDLDGVLRIAGLWDGVSGTVGKDEMYQGAKVEYAAKVTQVVLTEHQYSEGGDTKKLFEGTAQSGDIITFNAPMYNLSASGFSIQASGANWAKVSGGSGVLTGNEYVHNTRLITRNVQTANEPNVKTVDKATLVSLVNSSAVADRLVSYFKCKETINSDVVYKGENTGNIMSTYHPFDRSNVNSCLQSADVTLSNTLKAQEKSLVGFAPAQETGVEYEDRHETITSSGTWTVPDGVTEVTVVCIGGGTGGYSGYYGESTSDSAQAPLTQSTSNSYYMGYYPGEGCLGGDGGQPGGGGKVYTETIRVTGGESIQATVGAGGIGGLKTPSGSNAGSHGGATVFGSVSSDSGSSSENGYTDIVSGIKYATPGTLVGISGGKGGTRNRVASASETMQPGESVTDRNGITWSPGPIPSTSDRYRRESGSFSANSGKGMGGGAAAGGNGYSGSYYTGITVSSSSAWAKGGTGGRGGDAAQPPQSSVRGGGGIGGNGGGGGGGPGLCGAERLGSSSSSGLSVSRGYKGEGGAGSNGGQGGDGIIILYYRVPKILAAGQFVDKNGKRFLDKISRKFVV